MSEHDKAETPEQKRKRAQREARRAQRAEAEAEREDKSWPPSSMETK